MEWWKMVISFEKDLLNQERRVSTINNYKKDLRLFETFLTGLLGRNPTLEDVTADYIQAFLKYNQTHRKNQAATCQRHYYTISSLCSFAYRTRLVERNEALSVERIKVIKEEPTKVTEEEFQQLEASIDHPLVKQVAMFLFYTGLRISECLRLTIDDINLEAKTVHVRNGKGGKQRIVPLIPIVVKNLQNYLDSERPNIESNRLFATKRTGALSDVYVNRHLLKAVQKLGWKKKVTCHVLRHSYASHLVKKGVHHVYIQRLLGHESLASTGIYTHVEEEDIEESLQILY